MVHRINKDALSVHTSLDNINFKTVDRSKWEFSLNAFGNIVITFDEQIETRYLKIHSQFEDLDENDEIINLSQFKNLLKDMVHVYQMSEEGIIEYDYDSVGNRTEKKRILDSGVDEIKYYYDSGYGKGNGRRLLCETAIGLDGVESNLYGYRYDENGNLVEKSNRFTVKATGDVELITSGVGVEYWKYEYDVQNRMVRVEKNRDVIVEYGYDVDGMRVLSKINDKRTKYIYNFVGNVVYEEGDEEASSYIYGHGKIIAEVKGTVGSSGEVYYYHHDNLGSTRLITDSSGQVVMDQDYLPFGDDLNRPSVLENESSYETGYKYTGQHQEIEIGLYYYGARFYDQRVGRFVSEDSYLGELENPTTQHPYLYVSNSPMKYVDPTGHIAFVPLLAKAGVGGAVDLMLQIFMNRYFNPEVSNLSEAIGKVNWWQVARSSAESLIPWRIPGGKLSKAAASAVGDIVVNTLHEGNDYSVDQAFMDFAMGFVGDLTASAAGDLIDKYGAKVVAQGLEKLGIDAKRIKKLTGIEGIDNFKYATSIDNSVTVIEKNENLPHWIKKSFKDENYRTVKTNEEITLYRVFGGDADAGGGFVTTQPVANRIQAKLDAALLPEWKNTRMYQATIKIPQETILDIGKVASQEIKKTGTVLPGGVDQILMPMNWPLDWIKEIKVIPSR